MNPRLLCTTLSLALALGLGLAEAALATGPADDALNAEVRQHRDLAQRGVWHNPHLPVADLPVAARESADRRLQAIVSSHDRARLDRGGWRNAFVSGAHYAAGEPLLAAAIGGGLTSAGAAPAQPARFIAAR